MTVPRVGVGVMIVQDGRVLMARRMSGQRPRLVGLVFSRRSACADL